MLACVMCDVLGRWRMGETGRGAKIIHIPSIWLFPDVRPLQCIHRSVHCNGVCRSRTQNVLQPISPSTLVTSSTSSTYCPTHFDTFSRGNSVGFGGGRWESRRVSLFDGIERDSLRLLAMSHCHRTAQPFSANLIYLSVVHSCVAPNSSGLCSRSRSKFESVSRSRSTYVKP
jgi:hypothetical protein